MRKGLGSIWSKGNGISIIPMTIVSKDKIVKLKKIKCLQNSLIFMCYVVILLSGIHANLVDIFNLYLPYLCQTISISWI